MTPSYAMKHRRKNRIKATRAPKYGRALCPICGEIFALTLEGLLRAHRVGPRHQRVACLGSGVSGLDPPRAEQAPEDELTC